ncbi:DNA helicase/exodeoxyribonuclease V, subunit B [Clostridium collagenovorans DSM 3089]|uniref:ATP-dependent helicase/deoxyribonuclease subunit B n=1 Tax=Clostridium collagenovorans DSM 3089 TaxID=1121306 RepID=A0A1M5WWL5_9CLOT|nr:PD-(D/E)XK nuclease family protein [Clostridium collagenovorans]SHH91987.1 DNA helicase/exodeoxyribonuclease V, subunit B [Clostridium collagenovorans DSM 3089]
MSLRFIYGRAGSGKSTYCINNICKAIKNDKNKLQVLLVPEQLSFETEKVFVKLLKSSGFTNLLVTNFKRLSYLVFKECGGIAKEYMSAAGKQMLIYKIMDNLKDELRVFNLAARNESFVPIVADIINEMKRYEVTPEELLSMKDSAEDNSLLYNKISDIGKIYEDFNSIINNGPIDSDDDLTRLAEKLDSCTLLDGAEIWIDEFSGFSPQQFTVISKLLRRASRVNVTLNMDYDESTSIFDDTNVFSTVKYMENKLVDIARDYGISLEEPIKLSHCPSIKFKDNKELAYLEENYVKYPFVPYKYNTEKIKLFKAVNVYSEVENVASEVVKLVRDKNLRYKDIAVVARDLSSYEKLIEAIFNEYDIPLFIDDKKEVTSNPIIVLITSVMDIFAKNWSFESVFRYLKTDLLSMRKEDIDILENYILWSGIKGKDKWVNNKQWNNKILSLYGIREGISKLNIQDKYMEFLSWTKELSQEELIGAINDSSLELSLKDVVGLTEDSKAKELLNSVQEIKNINSLREVFLQPIKTFSNKVKGEQRGVELCTSLFEFLEDIDLISTLEEKINYFAEKEEQQRVREYSQIWNLVLEVMDQVVEVLGEDIMTLEQFIKILSLGFSQHKMGFIPPAIDQVTVGRVDRIRSHNVKYLFVIGVNEGVFPMANSDEGIFTDTDRAYLKERGLELAKDTKALLFEEQYLVYTTLTLPSEFLRISYAIADHEGKALRPSMIIARLKAIFSGLTEESNIVEKNDEEAILNSVIKEIPSFNNLINEMHKIYEEEKVPTLWKSIYKWFNDNEEWHGVLENNLKSFDYSNQSLNLSPEIIDKLYGDNKYFSVSRLEKYMECPFSYFINYGLRAKERKKYELTPPDLGTFMHNVIEKFSNDVDKNNINWNEISNEWCEKIVDENIKETMGESTGYIFSSSPRFNYFKDRLRRVLLRSISLIIEHMKRGNFTPVGYEIEFGLGDNGYPPIEIELSNGQNVYLMGKIDRVDKLVIEDEEYFRVIDYKSGSKDLKLAEIYYGLQIQLLTYLDAILNMEGDHTELPLLPAGILYFKIDDPMISSKTRLSDEEIEEEIMKKLKMKGLVLADMKIIREMDNQIEGASLILPVALTSKGAFSSYAKVATREQFEELREHVRFKLAEACERMLSGDITIFPCKGKSSTSCAYCTYSVICGFDPVMKDNNYNLIMDLKDKEIWTLIEKELQFIRNKEKNNEELKIERKDGEI